MIVDLDGSLSFTLTNEYVICLKIFSSILLARGSIPSDEDLVIFLKRFVQCLVIGLEVDMYVLDMNLNLNFSHHLLFACLHSHFFKGTISLESLEGSEFTKVFAAHIIDSTCGVCITKFLSTHQKILLKFILDGEWVIIV